MSNNYRLHIDLPFDQNLDSSKEKTEKIMKAFEKALQEQGITNQDVNYRLGNDGDRQKSNYLQINENNHVNNKKLKIQL